MTTAAVDIRSEGLIFCFECFISKSFKCQDHIASCIQEYKCDEMNIENCYIINMAKKTQQTQREGKPSEKLLESSAPAPDWSSDEEEVDIEGIEVETPKSSKHTVNLSKSKPLLATKDLGVQRGVLYVGRLPKSVDESGLKRYFKQFGDVLRARVSRNKVTGASRHYAFVEFKDKEVAKVAAETMDNYLLLGHLLKVSVIENPKENLFPAKMNLSFREVDWRSKKYDEFHERKTLEQWEELQKKFDQEKKDKAAELAAAGIVYTF